MEAISTFIRHFSLKIIIKKFFRGPRGDFSKTLAARGKKARLAGAWVPVSLAFFYSDNSGRNY
jgi:hypothetical protein